MNCSNFFDIDVKKEDSLLYRDIIDNTNSIKDADYIYEGIIKSGVWDSNEHSFLRFLHKKQNEDSGFALTSQNEPAFSTYLEWREYLKEKAAVNRVFATNKVSVRPVFFLSMAEGFSSLIPKSLEEKGMSFIDMVSDDVNKNNVWNDTMDMFIAQYQATINNMASGIVKAKHQLVLDELNANRPLFRAAYDEYLASEINLKFGEIENEFSGYTEGISQSENRTNKDSTFDRSSNEFSPIEAAPKAIKMMLFTLTETDTEGNPITSKANWGFNRLASYTKTSAMIHQTLAEIPADINLFTEELLKKNDSFPVVSQIVNQINFYQDTFKYHADPNKRLKEQLLRTQFVNQFNKTKYNYFLHLIDKDGNLKIINSNIDKSTDVKMAEWENNLMLKMVSNPGKYTNDYIVANIVGFTKRQFAEWVGIEPSIGEDADKFYNDLPNDDIGTIKEIFIPAPNVNKARFKQGLRKKLEGIYKGRSDTDVKGRFASLAEHALKTDNLTVELQHYNPEGKLQYGISLNTYLTNKAKGLAYWAGNKEVLEENFPELFLDPYTGSSVFAHIIKENADNPIIVGISAGFRSEVSGAREITSKLTERDLAIQRIYGILREGTYNFPRAADRKIENVIRFKGLSGKGNMKDGGGLIADISSDPNMNNAVRYMLNHLVDELRANEAYSKLNVKGLATIDATTNRDFTLENGKSIFDMKSIRGKTVSELAANKRVTDFINTKLKEVIAAERKFLEENKITADDTASLLNDYGDWNNIVSNYAINYFLGTIETTKIFIGDPVLYGKAENFFKRMSMLNSTKEASRTDQEMKEYIQGMVHNGEELAGSTYERDGSTVRTLTFQDVLSDFLPKKDEQEGDMFSEEERDLINDVLGEDNAYNKEGSINEADGMALITYDEYRIMMTTYGEWYPVDEDLYQNISLNADYAVTSKHYSRIIPNKSQFVGKLRNSDMIGYNILAGRKFAFMVLAPGMFKKNTKLDTLNNYMLENSIGMAFFESASKFGHKVKPGTNQPANTLYNENGNIGIDPESIELLDYSEMGNQLKLTKPVDKGVYITESTQRRKIININLLKGGKVRDDVEGDKEELQTLFDDYEAIQSEKVNRSYDVLSSRLGFDTELTRGERLRRFVGSLTSMGKMQGFSSNELEALQSLLELPLLDGLLNKPKVEQFIMSKLKNNVQRQKRRGEALAQVTNVGFELATGMSRHDLKFYRYAKDKDGVVDKNRMLPMEVYSPLPKEFIDYVSNKYNEGNGVTQKALDKFNREVAKDNARYEKTGTMTNLTKMTFYSGFRIPNQAPSSSDVAKVKAFYMPHIGGIVMVPKALVLKTGSDFDIDKLNLYYPELIPYNSIATSFIKQNFPSRRNMEMLLQREGLGYVGNLTTAELTKLIKDDILEADYASLNSPLSKNINKLYTDTLKSKDRKSFITLKENLGSWYADPGKKPLSELTDKELSNRALINEIEITLHKANWKQLLTPLGDANLKGIRDDMREVRGAPRQETWSDIFTAKTNIEKMISFLAGKTGVSQTAVHTTSHANSQKADLKMLAKHAYFGETTPITDFKGVLALDT